MYRTRALLCLLAFLSLSLTGCFGGSDADDTPDPGTSPGGSGGDPNGSGAGPSNENGTTSVPTIEEFEDPSHYCVRNGLERENAPDLEGRPWIFGQSWTYSLVVDGTDHGETKLVYYDLQDNGQHYMVGTPTREEALLHAVRSINPMIGRVHQALYSPHESGDHADMFHFPLCDGSTWQTVFYGETFSLTASPTSISVPGKGNAGGYRIQGASAEGSTLTIDYALAAQWFTRIDLQRADGGTVNMDLTALDTGYTGEAFFLRGQKDEMVSLALTPLAGPPFEEHTVNRADGRDGPYDTIGIAVAFSVTTPGAADLQVLAPNGTTMYQATLTSNDGPLEALVEVPYAAGDWIVRRTGGAADPAGGSTGNVTLVSIYDRSSTV